MDNSSGNSGPKIADRIIPRNELASSEPTMSFEDLIKTLYRIQDELNARGLNEPAILVHRAAGKLTICGLNAATAKKLEAKSKNEAA